MKEKKTKKAVYKATIPLAPITKKNSSRIVHKQIGGKRVPIVIPSKQYETYEKDALWFLKDVGIDYPVNVTAHFYMPTRRTVDLNNLNASLHDVLVAANTLVDDSMKYIVATDGSRVYYDKENPRTEVIITPMEPTFVG